MPTTWLIDGYNFIRTSKRFGGWEAESPQEGREAALRWLGEFAQLTEEVLWVIFDAYSRLAKERANKNQYGLQIIESRGSYTADEEIVELARERGESAIVISSDREVLENAKKAGAGILTSQEFEREVAKILTVQNNLFQEEHFYSNHRNKGTAFRPPKEKKKAYQRLRRYQ